MKITIVGGWDTDDTKNKEWELELDNGKKDELKEFCRTLGRSLAMKRHTVFVGSDDKDKSVEPYVVERMLEQLAKQDRREERPIRPIQGIGSNKEFDSGPTPRRAKCDFLFNSPRVGGNYACPRIRAEACRGPAVAFLLRSAPGSPHPGVF